MSKREELRKAIEELRRAGLILTADGEQVRERPERVRRAHALMHGTPGPTRKEEMMEHIRARLQHRGNEFAS